MSDRPTSLLYSLVGLTCTCVRLLVPCCSFAPQLPGSRNLEWIGVGCPLIPHFFDPLLFLSRDGSFIIVVGIGTFWLHGPWALYFSLGVHRPGGARRQMCTRKHLVVNQPCIFWSLGWSCCCLPYTNCRLLSIVSCSLAPLWCGLPMFFCVVLVPFSQWFTFAVEFLLSLVRVFSCSIGLAATKSFCFWFLNHFLLLLWATVAQLLLAFARRCCSLAPLEKLLGL